eukprot:6190064-Pleurochrysis_carterae.AAC.1
MADTSYSNMDEPDNRGAAVCDVVLNADGSAIVRGKLEDGERIAYGLHKGVGPLSELVGQIEPDKREIAPKGTGAKLDPGRRFVKAYLPRRRHYLMCNVDGFRYTYDRMPGELVRLLLGHAVMTKENEAHFVSPASITRLHSHGDEHCTLHENSIATAISDIFAEIDSNKSGLITMDELQARNLCIHDYPHGAPHPLLSELPSSYLLFRLLHILCCARRSPLCYGGGTRRFRSLVRLLSKQ